jgi:D-sedoheptulose 7-phosphate isomerase
MIDDIRNQLLASIDVKTRTLETCVPDTQRAAQLIIDCLKAGGRLYLCGNGGSAADCQHVACELVGRFMLDRKALPAVALTTDTSILTSVANDYDYEEVFARQVAALVREGDILLALSTSGNSTSVIKAAVVAHQHHAKVIALTGAGGGRLKELADCHIAVPGETAPRIQEVHITLLHIICALVERALYKD